MGRVIVALALVAAILTPSSGWAAPRPEQTPAAGVRRWPAPPAPARIRFVQVLDPQHARHRTSFLSRLATVLFGGRKDPVMRQPSAVAVGADGRVFVADTYSGTVHVFDPAKSGYSQIAVDGTSLVGIAVEPNRLYLSDSASGRVLALDARGRKVWTAGPAQGFERPTGLAISGDRLYVADTLRHLIVVLDKAGREITRWGGRGSEPGELNYPTHVACDAQGRVYVTDSLNFRVQVFEPSGVWVRSFGKLGDGAGDFSRPKGVGVDHDGHVYVVEGLNDFVQIFDSDGRLLLAFGESGQSLGQFWLPGGMTIVNDRVYVADTANRRVQVFDYLPEAR